MDFYSRYEFNPKTDLLGKGGFSKVYRATDTLLERTVALKFYTANVSEKYQILNEIKKVIRFEHPNLCKYYDVEVLSTKNIVGEMDRTEVGIMEYLDAGDFKTYLKSHPSYIDKLLIDILKGLSYLHKKGIVHRDLKPQNILIKMVDDEPVAKITDFGISKLINSEDNNSSALMGTIEYMAPEQFNPKKYGIGGRITTNLDLWSYGLLVYEAILHKPLFGSRSTGTSAEQVMRNILSESSLSKVDDLPPEYREIVKRCLVKDASVRVQNAHELIPLFNREPVTEKITVVEEKIAVVEKIPEENISLPSEVPVVPPVQQTPDENTQVLPPKEDTVEIEVKEDTVEEVTGLIETVQQEPNEETTLLDNYTETETKIIEFTEADNRPTEFIEFNKVQAKPQPDHQPQKAKENRSEKKSRKKLVLFLLIPFLLLTSFLFFKYPAASSTQVPASTVEPFSDFSKPGTIKEGGDRFGTGSENSRSGTKAADTTSKINERKSLAFKGDSVSTKKTFEVFFTSPVESLLEIDGKPFGTVKANARKKLNLPLGTYKLSAKNIATGVVTKYKLDVRPDSSSVVVIPMNAVIKMGDIPQITDQDKPAEIDTKKAPDSVKVQEPPKTEESDSEAEVSEASILNVAAELKLKMVLIDKGSFEMGYISKRKEERSSHSDELPEHSVTVPSFYFGKYEVTQKQWKGVMGYNPSTSNKDCGTCPVEGVSWEDVRNFLTRINKVSKMKFRLPTEAEWEYVAGKTGADGNKLKRISWHYENSELITHPVGSLPADAGIYDLFGNVGEWCSDWYGVNYYKNSPAEKPAGPLFGKEKVVRGGSFNDFKKDLGSSYRNKLFPGSKSKAVGFRLVIEAN